MHTNRARLFIAAAGLAVLAYFVFVPPIAQDETYHCFADSRTIWGIPYFWNVASNLSFAIVGMLGLWKLLVWDRLPMTAGSSDDLGAASVLWWRITNDLRPYALVQFVPFLILVPALWFVRDARYLAAVFGFYALAKLAEFWDREIFSGLPISGHSIKHVLAGIATYFVLRWRLAAAL